MYRADLLAEDWEPIEYRVYRADLLAEDGGPIEPDTEEEKKMDDAEKRFSLIEIR